MADVAAPKSSGGGGGGDDQAIELVLFIAILGFLLFSTSGAIVSSFAGFEDIAFIYYSVIVLKIISGVVGTLSVIGTVYVVFQLIVYRDSLIPMEEALEDLSNSFEAVAAPEKGAYAYEWGAIKNRLDTASDSDAALIIIEADALVDRILQDKKLPGTTMGERMQALGEQKFQNIDHLWEVHKLRNQVAHEGAMGITYSDAVYALEKYERVLQELEAI